MKITISLAPRDICDVFNVQCLAVVLMVEALTARLGRLEQLTDSRGGTPRALPSWSWARRFVSFSVLGLHLHPSVKLRNTWRRSQSSPWAEAAC